MINDHWVKEPSGSMPRAEWHQVIHRWQLPQGGELLDRIEQMIRPALLAGYFGSSPAQIVAGWQNHPGGRTDTAELARLANIARGDRVLDAGCSAGGPAIQLAETQACRVTGIDLAPNCIAAANRIAELAGLAHLTRFRVADAGNLPFEDGVFTVVWNQGRLERTGTRLREFDRVLAPGGRMAMTFEIGKKDSANRDSGQDDGRWSLDAVVQFIQALGYSIEQQGDITARDIESGWKALDRELCEREREYTWLLGADWVRRAHEEFHHAIAEMECGEWGTGRVIARKGSEV